MVAGRRREKRLRAERAEPTTSPPPLELVGSLTVFTVGGLSSLADGRPLQACGAGAVAGIHARRGAEPEGDATAAATVARRRVAARIRRTATTWKPVPMTSTR